MLKGKNLIGKNVEVVPWHKTFRNKEYILTGKLLRIKKVKITALDVEKHKRKFLHNDDVFVIKPTDEDRKVMIYNGIMKPRARLTYRVASGHKIRRKK